MNHSVLLYAGLVLLGTFISAVSQAILKKEASKEHKSLVQEYLNLPIVIAYGIFVLATFCSIFAYKVIPLSMGPILEATSYIYVTFFGVKLFGERINRGKVLALALIIIGISVYSLLG
ncbi:Solute carrier family 35 [Lachnospiraceae bacterium XBD2001]|nr:Solute carrier family 35 [Lachnospiraceae bacterium XBD2001]